MGRGKFIVFEGIDGSGKTTQARRLRDRLSGLLTGGRICELQEEPYGADVIGGIIRSVLSGQTKMPEDSLAYLFAANRLTHISDMEPKLASGNHIICDRYYFSNFAYNQTESLSLEDLIRLNGRSMEVLRPDLVFYLSVSPEVAAARRGMSRLTEEKNDALEKQLQVAANYERILERFSDPADPHFHRICRIDCDDLTEDMAAEAIWDQLMARVFPDGSFD